jgi:hypothetical protein
VVGPGSPSWHRTVAFEPADVYEFVDRADPKRVYAAVVDEAIQAEIGTPPGRVVLTAGRTRTWTNAGSGTSSFSRCGTAQDLRAEAENRLADGVT